MQLFLTPAGIHEFDRQPVEQFGMRRPLALRAEIFGRAHDSSAEITRPDSIDRHARGQGVVARDQPARERESIRRLVLRQRGEDRRHVRLDGLAGSEKVTANEKMRFSWLRTFFHDQGRRQARQFGSQGGDRLVARFESGVLGAIGVGEGFFLRFGPRSLGRFQGRSDVGGQVAHAASERERSQVERRVGSVAR